MWEILSAGTSLTPSISPLFARARLFDVSYPHFPVSPLTDDTRMMIGEEEIGSMKDGAIIINTAREGILDEYAAAGALRAEKLLAVGLDVVKQGNRDGMFVSESPLFECKKVVYTPHQSGNSNEDNARSHIQVVENVCRVLNGEKLSFIVKNVSY